MNIVSASFATLVIGVFTAAAAQADCSGGLGRGWASGKGNGTFEMTAADKSCAIEFPAFINDTTKVRTPATEMALTRGPKNGKISLAKGKGLVYTPAAGFKGKDKFCIKNTTPEMKGKSLSGCVTVTVK